MRPILTILIISALACFVALVLGMAGCQTRYEPPGEGLWRAL